MNGKTVYTLGVLIGIYLCCKILAIRRSNKYIKRSKEEGKDMVEIAKDMADDSLREGTINVQESIGISKIIYTTFFQRLSNIFRVVEILFVLTIITIVFVMILE